MISNVVPPRELSTGFNDRWQELADRAIDGRLLDAGDHKLLVAGYFHAVRERCFLRLRDRDRGDEAAQRVFAGDD